MHQTPSLLITHHIWRSSNTGGCFDMGTLGNVPSPSAHGRCTVAALNCIQWKAHHKFHVSLVDTRPIDMYYTMLYSHVQKWHIISQPPFHVTPFFFKWQVKVLGAGGYNSIKLPEKKIWQCFSGFISRKLPVGLLLSIQILITFTQCGSTLESTQDTLQE